MSQAAFAEHIGAAKITITSYETGVRKPSLDICKLIIKAAKAKGIAIDSEYLRPDKAI